MARTIVWGIVGVLLVTSLVYRLRSTRTWAREWNRGAGDVQRFVRQGAERIPENGIVYLVVRSGPSDPEPLRYDSWEAARVATLLYPRTVHRVTMEDLRTRAPSSEHEWVFFVSEPFDARRSWIRPLRDLR